MGVVILEKKKLEEMRQRYVKELEALQMQLQQAINTANRLQIAVIDRQSKIEVINELLKESEK